MIRTSSRIAAVLALCAAATGCTTTRGAKITAGVSAGLTVASTLVVGNGDGDGSSDGDVVAAGAFIAFVSMCTLAGSLVAWPYYAAEEDDVRGYAREQARRDAQAAAANAELENRRAHAWRLTKQAEMASRNGDCSTVLELGRQVVLHDPEFYRDVFIRDRGIQRCFADARPPQEKVTPPTPP